MTTSLLLWIIQGVVMNIKAQSNVCIWGASSTNQMLNGEYTYAGANIGSNGKPYYRLTVDSSCAIQGVSTFYLFNYQNIYWMIGKSYSSTSNVYALCQTSSNEPLACNNNWQSGFGTSQVSVTYGSCPQLSCGIITTSLPPTSPCGTIFNEKIGINQWKGYNQDLQQDVYFYFAPQWFRWICDHQIDDSCNINPYDQSSTTWNTIPQGSYMNLYFDVSSSTERVNCVGMYVHYL